LELDEKNADAWNNLGSIYEEMGKEDEAIPAYRQSLNLNNFQEEAHFNLARLEYEKNQENFIGEKAEEIRKRLYFILSINPKNSKALQMLKNLEEDQQP
jgi:Flp pilus assembly protein TadD